MNPNQASKLNINSTPAQTQSHFSSSIKQSKTVKIEVSDDDSSKDQIDEDQEKPKNMLAQKKVVPDVGMSPVGKTLKFPRRDNLFKKKESLPYDEVQSLVWQTRPR